MALARAPVEHHAYNTNAKFANVRPYRARALSRLDAGVDGALDSPLPSAIARRIYAPTRALLLIAVIAAAAITNVIRRRARISFVKVESYRSLNQVSR
jgi:hypothetical protein